ncbi:MAG: oligosaccharide flippase family protein [Luteolibacter sp.]
MTSFASKARSAVIWNAGFNLFRDGLQFATMLVLVRLLPKEAYGQFGFVTSIVGFISIFAFGNFISHALQVKDIEDACFQEHFTAGAVLNLGMFVVTNGVAVALRWSPTWAAVAPLLHVMSVSFVLEWPCELRRKMIERDFDWKTLRILHASGLALTAVLALGMARSGCGTYALLVPGMAVTLPFIYDLFFRLRWRPTWQWSWELYKPSFIFGVTRLGSGLVVQGRTLMESSTLAGIIGFASLGLLNRSIGLSQLFCIKLASQLLYAIYPILTRIGNTEGNAARVSMLVVQTVAWTTIPLATAFGLLSTPVVSLIYGKTWLEVIPLVPWAMGWGVASALCQASYMLLLARQQQKLCLYADALILCGTGLALWLALPHGLAAYLIASISVQCLALAFVTFWLRRLEAVSLRGWLLAFTPALVAAAASATIVCLLGGHPDSTSRIPLYQSIAWGMLFMACYTLALRVAFKGRLEILMPYLPFQSVLRRLLLLPQRA